MSIPGVSPSQRAMQKSAVKVITAIAAIVLAGFGTWCLMSLPATSLGTPESITIGNMHIEGSALIYIAKDQGFFKQNGLNVTIRDYDTGLAAINGLLNGDVEVADTAGYPLVGMAFKKEKIQTIGSIDKSEIEYFVGRKDHGIENISDLKGKMIGLPRGTLPEFYLGRFLELHDMDVSDVTIFNLNLSQSEDALVNRDVDAIVNWQPYTNTVQGRLGSNAVVWPVQNHQESYGLMICRNDWITKNPELVNRFLRSLAQAEEFASNHPAAAKAIVKKQMNFSDAYMETVWQQNQFSLSLDQSLITAMEDEGRWMIKNNLTTEKAIPNFRNYISTLGLEEVKPGSVNIIG